MFGVGDWITGVTSGVPQLLCPAELAEYWEGINAPSNERVVESDFRVSSNLAEPTTDYDLACAISFLPQEAGLISVATGEALVICGEIPFAAWIPATDFSGGYIVVPAFWTEVEVDCHEIIPSINPISYFDAELILRSNGSGFILFAATDSALDANFEFIQIPAPLGTYKVGTFFYDTPDFQLRLIRIKAKDSN